MTKSKKKKLTPEEKDKRLGVISLFGGIILSIVTIIVMFNDGAKWLQVGMIAIDGSSIVFGICLAGGRTKNKKTIIISLAAGAIIAGIEMAIMTPSGAYLFLGITGAVIAAFTMGFTMLFMME